MSELEIASTPANRRTLLMVGIGVWLALLLTGFFSVALYTGTAGDRGKAPEVWPKDSKIALDRWRATAVLFVHPRCPCSIASLSELNVINNAAPGQVAVQVVFFKPPAAVDSAWERTAAWADAGRIAGAARLVDEGGAEARRFGAQTSGHLVLYGPAGELRFAGGITESRGHAGDNAGRRAVLKQIAGGGQDPSSHAVFGCALDDPNPEETLPGDKAENPREASANERAAEGRGGKLDSKHE